MIMAQRRGLVNGTPRAIGNLFAAAAVRTGDCAASIGESFESGQPVRTVEFRSDLQSPAHRRFNQAR
jgi:hypothetical protein